MPTSSDAACRVQPGSSTPGIVSESGLPMRMSAKPCIFLFVSQSTILMRMHVQLQPLSPAEDQMFWHCAVWAVWQEKLGLRLQQRAPEDPSHQRVGIPTNQPNNRPKISRQDSSRLSKDKPASPIALAAAALNEIALLPLSLQMKLIILMCKQVSI